MLKIRATKDGQALEITKFTQKHNHEITELEYKFHPSVRKVDKEIENEIASHLQLNASRKLVQQTNKEKTGKNILLKDVYNIATRAKENSPKNVNSSASEVESLHQWLQEKFRSMDCEFVVGDNTTVKGIFIQDAEMKSTFERYPEVLLADSTYKTNNLNMALYAVLAVDGLGESHVVASFFVTSEDKTSLEDMLQRFRRQNPRWRDVATVITDKDMTERSVFKSIFPQVDLQICLYHTLRTFSREVTMDKMHINSAERTLSLEFLEKLAYAQDEAEYQDRYRSFCNEVPTSVTRYFTANWHDIRVEWVKGLKSIHLQNNTTNRVESFFSKLKAYFSPRSELKETP